LESGAAIGQSPSSPIRRLASGQRSTPLAPRAAQRFNPVRRSHARANQYGRKVMAKGQIRSNKEKKKPKAEWNKKKKGSPASSPFALTREQPQPGQNPFGKKS
jgi:hypothetical protein